MLLGEPWLRSLESENQLAEEMTFSDGVVWKAVSREGKEDA